MTFHLEAAALSTTTTSYYLCVVLEVKFAGEVSGISPSSAFDFLSSDREISEIIPPSDVRFERLSYHAFILSEEMKYEFPQREVESQHVASTFWII